MTALLPLLLTLEASSPTAGIAIAKLSGVSQQVAQTRAEALRTALLPEFSELPIEDFTACKARRPCQVEEARKRGWKAAVLLETATIVDDALVTVTLVSIDDDGREFAKFSRQAPESKLLEALGPASAELRTELRKLAGTTPPPPTPPSPEPPAAEPPLVTAAAPTNVTAAPPSEKPVLRWAPLTVGVASVAVGVLFVSLAEGAAQRLRGSLFASPGEALELAQRGSTFQTTGFVLLGVGAALSLGGTLLGALWPDATIKPLAALSPQAGVLGVQGVLP